MAFVVTKEGPGQLRVETDDPEDPWFATFGYPESSSPNEIVATLTEMVRAESGRELRGLGPAIQAALGAGS